MKYRALRKDRLTPAGAGCSLDQIHKNSRRPEGGGTLVPPDFQKLRPGTHTTRTVKKTSRSTPSFGHGEHNAGQTTRTIHAVWTRL